MTAGLWGEDDWYRLSLAYEGVEDLRVIFDCAEHPCLVALTGTDGVNEASQVYREFEYGEGLHWCGKYDVIFDTTLVVVECYADPEFIADHRDAIRDRVSELAEALGRAAYPRDQERNGACDAPGDCMSVACEPATSLSGCAAERCCAERCTIGGAPCQDADKGVECVSLFAEVAASARVRAPVDIGLGLTVPAEVVDAMAKDAARSGLCLRTRDQVRGPHDP
jgi:hypothetical protein